MVLNYFENDYYSSSGYPSSMGKFNFMRLVYHSAKADDIIRNSLMLSDAKSYFFANIDNFFTVDEFVAKLAEYAHGNYVSYYNLGATKVTVYVDYDEDGKADEIEVGSELEGLVEELLQKVNEYILKSKDNYTTALSSFISEYKGTERFGDDTNPTKTEYLWAKYRKAGIVVASETLTATADSKLTDDVVDLIKKYYNDETIMDLELGLVSEVVSNEIFFDDNKCSSLIVTSGTLRTSAKFDDEEAIEKMYTNIPSIYNEAFVETILTKDDFANEEANAKLIKAYLYDYLLFQSVSSLPTSTTSALGAYLLPLLQRYVSGTSQQIIIKNTLGTVTFDYTEACHVGLDEAFDTAFTRADFANERYVILERQYDEYEEAYENWWNTFYTGLKEAK
jgi:hypothetical protein